MIAEPLKALLKERELSPTELAKQAGIGRATVYYLLSGGPTTTRTLEKIAGAFGKSVAELLSAGGSQ